MRVAITGASGFVGKNLLLRIPESWEVFGIFNSSTDFEDFVKRYCGSNVISIKCNLTDSTELKRLKNVFKIIHESRCYVLSLWLWIF